MIILGIDPGPTKSGWCEVECSGEGGLILPKWWGQDTNQEVLLLASTIGARDAQHVAIEKVVNYGRAVGKDVFEQVFWTGRFFEAAGGDAARASRYSRPEVCLAVCGITKATKAEVRQGLIDIYGGEEVAIGGKKCWKCKGKGWFGAGRPVCPECGGKKFETPPGPLYGMTGPHAWDAFAVAWKAAKDGRGMWLLGITTT